MKEFNLKKLSEVEGKEVYYFQISNNFTDLENLHTVVDINRA
jgi:hypothetical protein